MVSWLMRPHSNLNSNVEMGRNLLPMSPGIIRTRAVLNLGAQTCPPQACTGVVFAKRNPNVQAKAEGRHLRLTRPARNRVVRGDEIRSFSNGRSNTFLVDSPCPARTQSQSPKTESSGGSEEQEQILWEQKPGGSF